jgi:nucleoside-diphosphate-sugar epimerase
MHIAILGGTSQIAKDLARSLSVSGENYLSIYARRPAVVQEWLLDVPNTQFKVLKFEAFTNIKNKFDAIINFVGAGNPARVLSLGSDILRITNEFDQLALNYIKTNPDCRYIFASSGAVFGSDFSKPVNAESLAALNINNLGDSNWYGIAKLYAECLHRSLKENSIVDIRFFNYFSGTQDLYDRFLVTDALRAAKYGVKFKTSPENIKRDYMGPEQVAELILRILNSDAVNVAIDACTKQPVDKFQMLNAMRKNFGLNYEVESKLNILNSTGLKNNYFSENKNAKELFGYDPQKTALEIIVEQAEDCLSRYKM